MEVDEIHCCQLGLILLLRRKRWLSCWLGGEVVGDDEGGSRWLACNSLRRERGLKVADFREIKLMEGERRKLQLLLLSCGMPEVGEEMDGCRCVCMMLLWKSLVCLRLLSNFQNLCSILLLNSPMVSFPLYVSSPPFFSSACEQMMHL